MKTSTNLRLQPSGGVMAGVVQEAAVDVDRLVAAGRPIASAAIAAVMIGCILIPAQRVDDDPIPALGWLMLSLGIFFMLLVGCSLTALVFYSGRAGFDEPPELVQKKIPSSRRRAPAIASSTALQDRQSKDKTQRQDGRSTSRCRLRNSKMSGKR